MLKNGSPCIDAGNDTFVTEAFDIIGNDRILESAVDMGAYEWVYVDPCDPNPCGGGTPVCLADATPQGYTCYPQYNVGYCVVQWPKTIDGMVGDTADVFGRVWIDGITNITQDAVDISPLVKAQFGGRPLGEEFANDAWSDAAPNTAGGLDWDNDDEYWIENLPLDYPGVYEYAFRFSADGGATWTVCDVNGIAGETPTFGVVTVIECQHKR
jgi:hypothetical protein